MAADVLVPTDRSIELDAGVRAVGQALEERYRAPVRPFTFKVGREEHVAVAVGVEGSASVGVSGVTRQQLDSAQWSGHGRVQVEKEQHESRYGLNAETLSALLADVPDLADQLDGYYVHLTAEPPDSSGYVPVARFSEGMVERIFTSPDYPAIVIPVAIVE